MNRRTQFVVVAVGAVATIAIGVLLDLPAADLIALLGLAGGGALAAAAVGAVVLRRARSASIRAQAVIVALIAVVGTGVGVGGASVAMFVSSHDLGALLVVLTASATVAVVFALRFGSRIGTASTDLEELARRLGDGDLLLVGDRPAAVEFTRLERELAAASERLDDARRRERAMDDARRQLVAWVSHDLRTPLAGIQAMIEALQDGVVDDPDDVAEYHATVHREVDRLSALVDDLFELSRIEAGALDLRLEVVRLGEVLGEAVAGAAPLAASKGIELSGGGPQPDPLVEVAPAELVRVVRNLLDNAIRHTPAGGMVEVISEIDSERSLVRLSVRDACGGIPETDLDRVFDLAFRGDAARSGSTDQGGGLGLAIARGLVDAHHGHISVENESPGCRFTVELPVSG